MPDVHQASQLCKRWYYSNLRLLKFSNLFLFCLCPLILYLTQLIIYNWPLSSKLPFASKHKRIMDELTANHIYANPLRFRHQRNLSTAKPNTVLVPSFPLYSPNITIITGNGSCLSQILKDCLIAFRLGIRGKTSRGVSRLPTLSRLVFVSPLSNYKAFSHRESLTTYQVNLWHIMSKLSNTRRQRYSHESRDLPNWHIRDYFPYAWFSWIWLNIVAIFSRWGQLIDVLLGISLSFRLNIRIISQSK